MTVKKSRNRRTMMEDWTALRWALGSLLVAGIAIGLPFRLRGKRRDPVGVSRRSEGWVMMIGLRLCGVLTMACVVAFLADPRAMRAVSLDLPGWLRWSGFGLALVAWGLLIWMFRSLSTNVTDTVAPR